MNRLSVFVAVLGAALLAPTVARATLLFGSQLHITGDAQFGTTFATWACNEPADTACVVPPSGQGDFAISASTGSFAQYNSTFGLIADINDSVQPLNAPFSLPNFITFDLNNDITIELTFIPLGNDTPSSTCNGIAHCTPQSNSLVDPNDPGGLSAYNLDSNINGTAVTFGVIGTVHEAGGDTADLSGLFSATFVGLDAADTLTLMNSGANATFSGDFNLTESDTPEPASIVLSGIGIIALGLVSGVRRRLSPVR